jgi:hypothetical protein
VKEWRMGREQDMDRLCDVCPHRYGDHYETFDKTYSGCDADTGGAYYCECEGFCEDESED